MDRWASERDAGALSGADGSFGFGGRSRGGLEAGTDLGQVTIVRLIAEGGMGRVYEARQRHPDRVVAVKVMRDAFASASLARRFEYEAQLLARLRHPHIAQIHTFGIHEGPSGPLPFFVMEFVEAALPITRYADERRLSVQGRLALFRRACDAIAHAHQKGVIHRDIKPGNVLVDPAGDPKVIDFGVGRAADDAGRIPDRTEAGDLLGTIRYMSPEQLGVEQDDVDARSDVYALGLVLHELLVGTLPYELAGRSVLEAAAVLGDESQRPATLVARSLRGRATAAEARSLATVVAMCLARRPANRYATAVELRAELDRLLAGEPVLARPPTALESLSRFARRHRAAAVAAVGVTLALVAALAGVSLFSLRADAQRRIAESARADADARQREAAREAAHARGQLYVSDVLLAAESRDRENVAEARRLVAEARALLPDAAAGRPLELDWLAASLDESVLALPGGGVAVSAVAWSPDRRLVAAGSVDGSLRIHEVHPTGTAAPRRLAGHEATIWSVAWSPDGTFLATGSSDRTVRIWSAADGSPVRRLEAHAGPVYGVAFAPAGDLLATASRDRTVRLWNADTWSEAATLRGHEGTVYAVCFSPAGDVLASASLDCSVGLWDVATGRRSGTLTGHDSRVFHAAFSPDGRTLVSCSEDRTARVWDVATLARTEKLVHPFRVNAAAFVGDGSRLATVGGDGVLRIWDPRSGKRIRRLRGHEAGIWSVAAAGTSGLATGSMDGTIRFWDVADAAQPVLRSADKVLAAAWSPDGSTIATAGAESVVRLWDSRTLRPTAVLRRGVGRINALAFDPGGTQVAGASDDGAVRIWTLADRRRLRRLDLHEQRVYSVTFSPDGGLLATASDDRTARLWHVHNGEPAGPPLRHPRRVFCATFSTDGRLLATACEDRSARLWDVATGRELRRLAAHRGPVNWAAFSACGRQVATACSDGTVRLWRVADGALERTLTGPAAQVWKVAFTPDSTRVAAVSADGTAQLWHAGTGRPTPMLRAHCDQAWAVAFSPDGSRLVTGSWDGTARIWGAPHGSIARALAADRP